VTWLRSLLRLVSGSARDLAPIVLVIALFQLLVLRQPFPDLGTSLVGLGLVLLGLALFVRGLDLGLFPLGESMAYAFAHKGSLGWLLAFSFALGFGATVAEPALMAIAREASEVAAHAGAIADTHAAREQYSLGLRLTVAMAVGVGLVAGVWRILSGRRRPRGRRVANPERMAHPSHDRRRVPARGHPDGLRARRDHRHRV
jgi:hypothetical protein